MAAQFIQHPQPDHLLARGMVQDMGPPEGQENFPLQGSFTVIRHGNTLYACITVPVITAGEGGIFRRPRIFSLQ